jgi:UDP-glucose 4-epimerase
MSRILLLGGAGFIGRAFLERLGSLPESHEIYVIDKKIAFPHDAYGDVRFITLGDEKISSLVRELRDIDIVYYFASSSVPAETWEKPEAEIHSNLLPFMEAASALCELGVKKICFISSGGTVYGDQQGFLNEDTPLRPFSPYGIFKVCQENLLEYYRVKNHVNYTIFRISNAYGPNQPLRPGFGVINTWVNNILNGKEIQIYGNGEAVKDYIFIDDISDLLLTGINDPTGRSDIYNLSSGQATSLNNILDILRKVSPARFEAKYVGDRASDNKYCILDNTRILQSNPGYRFTSLEEGISRVVDFYFKNK